ncbi:MAG: peptidoglycan DD-metalloendopeptidase family protein [Proteobacteria bacterium]|nr:peptidoglycan DD-metalloendopeptidase family protein [Pseudomonadota bacterium]
MKAMSRALLVALLVAVAGCATRTPAPVIERAPLSPPPPRPAAPAAAPAPAAPAAEATVPTYTVKRGDTLALIALDQGLDYHDLAAWNNIENINLIRVGQVLRLTAPGTQASAPAAAAAAPGANGVVTTPLRTAGPIVESKPAAGDGAAPAGASTAPAGASATPGPQSGGLYPPAGNARSDLVKTAPKALKEPYSADNARDYPKALAAANAATRTDVATAAPSSAAGPGAASAPAVAPAPTARSAAPALGSDDDRLDWMWPAKGKLLSTFSEASTLKGIDIAGQAGQPVVASAAGKVVYAGSGLRGYGQLVIIKHNDTYLSAYAHNSKIVVKEGDTVARGTKIAEMGNTDADQVKLHFEIRRQGKPMDPQKYLPPQS